MAHSPLFDQSQTIYLFTHLSCFLEVSSVFREIISSFSLFFFIYYLLHSQPIRCSILWFLYRGIFQVLLFFMAWLHPLRESQRIYHSVHCFAFILNKGLRICVCLETIWEFILLHVVECWSSLFSLESRNTCAIAIPGFHNRYVHIPIWLESSLPKKDGYQFADPVEMANLLHPVWGQTSNHGCVAQNLQSHTNCIDVFSVL